MNVSDLREILQYVPLFRERTFVIAVDGAVAAHANFTNILLDIAVLRSLNINVVLVHGAAYQVVQLGAQRKVRLSDFSGSGVTDETTLQVSIDAGIRLTHEIIEGLAGVDLRAAYINAIIANSSGILGGKDYKFTGRVDRVDVKALTLLLNEGVVPVVPPLGFDGEGRTFRVNSDTLAVDVAAALGAAKIIYLVDPAVEAELPRQIQADDVSKFLRSQRKHLPETFISKLKAAAYACEENVPRVHLLPGNVNEAMLTELFSREGFGAMIYSNEYQQIRRALKKDVRAIMALTKRSVRDSELIRRTRNDIVNALEDYWVLEVDGHPVACVALHIYPKEKAGELACLHVAKAYENQGYGRILTAFVEDLARKKGVKTLFALSTQAVSFFQQKAGFSEAALDDLPEARRERLVASKRNSRVLKKRL